MLKVLGGLAVSFLIAGALAAAVVIPHSTPAYGGHYSDATVVKVALDGGHGSGVYIGNGRIITAAHVAKESPADGFTVTDYLGTSTHAHVVWFDEATDVGLLVLDTPFVTNKATGAFDALQGVPMTCGQPDVAIGDFVETIGYPLSLDRIHTWGRVASSVDARHDKQVNFLADLTIAPGNSGGPVFDIAGNLAGIAVAMPLAPIGQNTDGTPIPALVPLTYVIPKSVICRGLAENVAARGAVTPTKETE